MPGAIVVHALGSHRMSTRDTRQQIARALRLAKTGKCTVKEIAAKVQQSESWVYHHEIHKAIPCAEAAPSGLVASMPTPAETSAALAAFQQQFEGSAQPVPQTHPVEDAETAASIADRTVAPDVLHLYASHPDPCTRFCVVTNPNTSEETLRAIEESLLKDPDPRVMEGLLLYRRDCPPDRLQRFAQLGIEDARLFVAAHPNTPSETLRQIAEDDPDWDVRKALALNANTPPETLRQLAEHSDNLTRQATASNVFTPTDVLRRLAEDPDERVSAAAKQTLEDHAERTRCGARVPGRVAGSAGPGVHTRDVGRARQASKPQGALSGGQPPGHRRRRVDRSRRRPLRRRGRKVGAAPGLSTSQAAAPSPRQYLRRRHRRDNQRVRGIASEHRHRNAHTSRRLPTYGAEASRRSELDHPRRDSEILARRRRR